MNHWKSLLSVSLGIMLCVQCYTKNTLAEVVEISASGTYLVGDSPDENFALAKDRARLEAKRLAAEKAGVYVEAYSKVNNLQLAQDEIHTFTAKVLKIKSEEFTVTTREDKYIVFTCTIVADVDTDNINMAQLKQMEALKKEITELRNMLAELQQVAKLTIAQETSKIEVNPNAGPVQVPENNSIKKPEEYSPVSAPTPNVDIPEVPAKPSVDSPSPPPSKSDNEHKILEPESTPALPPSVSNQHPKAEGPVPMAQENNKTDLSSVPAYVPLGTYDIPRFDHEAENFVVTLFPNNNRGSKPIDFVKRPKEYKIPSPKVDMYMANVVPNPEKWIYLFYSSENIPKNMPIWYDPTSVKLIKTDETVKLLCKIMTYIVKSNQKNMPYDLYMTYNVLIDYTDGYYMLYNKKIYGGDLGETRRPANYNEVDNKIPFKMGQSNESSLPDYMAEIASEVLNHL